MKRAMIGPLKIAAAAALFAVTVAIVALYSIPRHPSANELGAQYGVAIGLRLKEQREMLEKVQP